MNVITKSVIRHLLTALGALLGVIGLNHFVPVLDYLQNSLDTIWDSVIAIIGVVTTLIGFFTNKDRFKILETAEAKKTNK